VVGREDGRVFRRAWEDWDGLRNSCLVVNGLLTHYTAEIEHLEDELSQAQAATTTS